MNTNTPYGASQFALFLDNESSDAVPQLKSVSGGDPTRDTLTYREMGGSAPRTSQQAGRLKPAEISVEVGMAAAEPFWRWFCKPDEVNDPQEAYRNGSVVAYDLSGVAREERTFMGTLVKEITFAGAEAAGTSAMLLTAKLAPSGIGIVTPKENRSTLSEVVAGKGEDQLKWAPNAYRVEIDDGDGLEKIGRYITKVDGLSWKREIHEYAGSGKQGTMQVPGRVTPPESVSLTIPTSHVGPLRDYFTNYDQKEEGAKPFSIAVTFVAHTRTKTGEPKDLLTLAMKGCVVESISGTKLESSSGVAMSTVKVSFATCEATFVKPSAPQPQGPREPIPA